MKAFWNSCYLYGLYTARLVGAVAVFGRLFPRRAHFVLRNLLCLLLLCATVGFVSALGLLADDEEQLYAYFGYFEMTVSVLAVMLICFDSALIDQLFHILSAAYLNAIVTMLRQAAVFAGSLLLHRSWQLSSGSASDFWVNVALCLLIYGIAYFCLTKRINTGKTHLGWSYLFFMLAVSLTAILLSVPITSTKNYGIGLMETLGLAFYFGLILYMQYEIFFRQRYEQERLIAAAEKETIRLMGEQTTRQYEKLKESMELINIKVHDMKHQLAAVRAGGALSEGQLARLSEAVEIYDSTVVSGNEALDLILTEKRMLCSAKEIRLACVADGEGLRFMAVSDIYALFGNLLDNAIEYVETLPVCDRFIRLYVRQQAGMLSIHEENLLREELPIRDGLPSTHKADKENHGFGMKSLRYITEKYEGFFSWKAEDGLFCVKLLLPLEGYAETERE